MSDALFDLLHGILHLGKTKLEAGGEQPAGHDIATLDDQFGLSPMNKRRDFEHPTRRGQSEPGAAFPAKDLHHPSLLNRVRIARDASDARRDRKSTRLNSSH